MAKRSGLPLLPPPSMRLLPAARRFLLPRPAMVVLAGSTDNDPRPLCARARVRMMPRDGVPRARAMWLMPRVLVCQVGEEMEFQTFDDDFYEDDAAASETARPEQKSRPALCGAHS